MESELYLCSICHSQLWDAISGDTAQADFSVAHVDIEARASNAISIVDNTGNTRAIASTLHPNRDWPLRDELVSKIVVDETHVQAGGTGEESNCATLSIIYQGNRFLRGLSGRGSIARFVIEILIKREEEEDVWITSLWNWLFISSPVMQW